MWLWTFRVIQICAVCCFNEHSIATEPHLCYLQNIQNWSLKIHDSWVVNACRWVLSSFVINLAKTFQWQLLLNNLQHLLLIDLIIFSFAFYKHTRQYVCDFIWMLITVSVSICQGNTLSTIQDCIMMSLIIQETPAHWI